MKKAACNDAAEEHSGAAASKRIPYLRSRLRRSDPEREWADYEALRAAERALTAINDYARKCSTYKLPSQPTKSPPAPKKSDPRSYRARINARMRGWNGRA